MPNISVLQRTQASVPTPELNHYTLFLDVADGFLKKMDSSRSVTTLSGGGSAMYYQHTQAAPLAVWTINHNLGSKPNVQVFNNAGIEIIGEITQVTVNQSTVTFDTAVAGFAVCS